MPLEMYVKGRRGETTIEKHPVLLPHEYFNALYECQTPAQWAESIGSQKQLSEFWAHEQHKPWVVHHPGLPLRDVGHSIPAAFHGDDVAVQKNEKVCVLQWSSLLSRTISWNSRFLYTVLPYQSLVPDVTLPALLQVLVWSFGWLMVGEFPPTDPWGNKWECRRRQKLAGKRLAGRFTVVYAGMRADLPFFALCFKYNSFNMDNLCHRCCGHQKDWFLNFRNMLDDAGWRRFPMDHEHYMSNTAGLARSPLCSMPGWRLETNYWDTMHGLNLGVGQQLCGNVLFELAAESGIGMDKALEDLYNEFGRWLSMTKQCCSTPKFTKCGINVGKRSDYPELHIKAKNCEFVLRWLVEKTKQDHSSQHKKTVAAAVWSLNEFFTGMREADRFLTDAEIDRLEGAGKLFCLAYQNLSMHAHRRGVLMWNVVPKMHFFCHIIDDLRKERVNPRFNHCFCDEDFVGRIARIAGVTHRNSMNRRTLDRYLCKIHACWDAAVEVVDVEG